MKEESEGQRIWRLAAARGFTSQSLQSRCKINPRRMSDILRGVARPTEEERSLLAQVLGVHPEVLRNGRAEHLWSLLKGYAQEWRFEGVWPKVVMQTGLRGPDTLESDAILFREMILEDQKDRLWNPEDEPPWW